MSRALMPLFILLALAAIGCGRPQLPASGASPLLGRALPSVGQRTIDGRAFDPGTLAGKTVVVKFFAQYCAPCLRTLPLVQGLSTAHADVVVVGVAEDESEEVVRRLIGTYGLTFPVIHDRGLAVAGRFRVIEIPATFVAGPDGIVRWVAASEEAPLDVEQAVEALAP